MSLCSLTPKATAEWQSPAVRLGLHDAQHFELLAQKFDAFGTRGRKRRTRRADCAPHRNHGTLQRRGVLVLEKPVEPRDLVLAFACSFPVVRNERRIETVAQ